MSLVRMTPPWETKLAKGRRGVSPSRVSGGPQRTGGTRVKPSKRSPILVAVALATMVVLAVTAVGASASSLSARSSLHTIKVGAGPWTIGLSNGYYGNGARVQLEAEVKALAAQEPYKS